MGLFRKVAISKVLKNWEKKRQLSSVNKVRCQIKKVKALFIATLVIEICSLFLFYKSNLKAVSQRFSVKKIWSERSENLRKL